MKKYSISVIVENPRHDKLARTIHELMFQIAFRLGYKKVGIEQSTKGLVKKKSIKRTKK